MTDWGITLVNLSLGNLRLDILVFSASGVLIGGQIGAALSPYLPDRLLKTVFGVCILFIASVYIVTCGASTQRRSAGCRPLPAILWAGSPS